ncbi:hypothetical protein PG994_002794 [Apiospora phragmitis]|uniref:2EXR domain-containing protein n=1 Tax=Apiospora phragmitis TaxID=2905665 RepID=A0ABR1W6D7_9PEZI
MQPVIAETPRPRREPSGNSAAMETTGSQSFPQFSMLPLEIRDEIWDEVILAAYEGRAVVLNGDTAPRPPTNSREAAMPARLQRLRTQTVRVGRHLLPSPCFTATRESRAAALRLYPLELPVYGALPWHPALGGVPGQRAMLLDPNSGEPVPREARQRGCIHISLERDLIVMHNDWLVPLRNVDHWGPRIPFLYRRFPALAGPLDPAQAAEIRQVMIAHWRLRVPAAADPAFFSTVAATCADPLVDGLFGGARTRVDLYVKDREYHLWQYQESRGALATELLERFPGQSLRTPPLHPPPEDESEDADL